VPDVPWRQEPGGVLVAVRLTPRGGQDSLDGIAPLADGTVVLKARVRAAPEDGAANAALLRLLADELGLAVRDLSLAGGATSRLKRIRIAGDPAKLIAILEKAVQPGGTAKLAPPRKR